MKRFACVCIAFTLLIVCYGETFSKDDTVKTAIIGFINQGKKGDDSIQTVIGKSLFSFLNKLPGTDLLPLSESLSEGQRQGFSKLEKVYQSPVIKAGQAIGAGIVIAGEYRVVNEEIKIVVYGYDVVTGNLKFKKEYRGDAGPDIFDTIDNVVNDVAGILIGRKIELATLDIQVADTDQQYRVYLNGKYIDLAGKNLVFKERILAGMDNELVIRNASTMKEVYIELLNVKKGDVRSIVYAPVAKLSIETIKLTEPAIILIDGKKVGDAKEGTPLKLTNMLSGKPIKVQIVNIAGKSIAERNVTLDEAENLQLSIDLSSGRRQFYALMKGLEGGMEVSFGLDYRFLPMLKASLFGGIQLYNSTNSLGESFSTTFLRSDLEATFYFLGEEDAFFRLGATAFGTLFVATYGNFSMNISPGLGLKADISRFFINVKVRYSFLDNNFHPMIGVGIVL